MSASIIARPLMPITSVITESNLMFASSSVFCTRRMWLAFSRTSCFDEGGEVTDAGSRFLTAFGVDLTSKTRSGRIFCRPEQRRVRSTLGSSHNRHEAALTLRPNAALESFSAFYQCTRKSASRVVAPEIIDPMMAIDGTTPFGSCRLMSDATKIAAAGNAITK